MQKIKDFDIKKELNKLSKEQLLELVCNWMMCGMMQRNRAYIIWKVIAQAAYDKACNFENKPFTSTGYQKQSRLWDECNRIQGFDVAEIERQLVEMYLIAEYAHDKAERELRFNIREGTEKLPCS